VFQGGFIFSPNCTKTRLAAGLLPDPLREPKRSPDLLAAVREGEGGTRREGGRGEGRGNGAGEEGEGVSVWVVPNLRVQHWPKVNISGFLNYDLIETKPQLSFR
jgi:hypothetical protein